jgi:hypothetical protein
MLTRVTYLSPTVRARRIQVGWRRLGAILTAGIACASLMTSNEAASQVPQPAPESPAQSGQVPMHPEGASSDEPLGQQLSKSGGVIEPPAGIDSEIEVPAPQPDPKTTPVIPPPGSPGGDPSIQPK